MVPIIKTSHYQHQHILGVAKALQLRGAEVRVLICGEVLDGCEIKSVKNEDDPDPCWSCRFHARHTLPLYGLETISLADYVSENEQNLLRKEAKFIVSNNKSIEAHGMKLDQAVQDSIIRFFYGAVPNEEATITKVKLSHTMSALFTAEIAQQIDQEWAPDVIFNNMFCYSPWESFFKFFRERGDMFRSLSLQQFDFKTVVLDMYSLYGYPNRFKRYLEVRNSKSLIETEREQLHAFLSKRHAGTSDIFLMDKYFGKESVSFNQRELRFDKTKRNIFIFTNIYRDVGISDMSDL